MIRTPLSPGFYARPNLMLLEAAHRDVEQLREDWQDEASQAAVSGNPFRARYIETWIARLG